MLVRIPDNARPLGKLTVGKTYETLEIPFERPVKGLYRIKDDSGNVRVIYLFQCAHLRGAAWEIVEEALSSEGDKS